MDFMELLSNLDSSTIVLIVAGIIVLISVIFGFARGFLGTAFDMVQIILALVLVLMLQPIVGTLLREKTPLYEVVYENVEKTVRTVLEETIPNLTEQGFSGVQEGLSETFSSILPEGITMTGEQQSTFLNDLIDKYLPVPAIKSAIEDHDSRSVYEKLGVTDYPTYVASFISNLVVTAIGFVITLVVVLIVLEIIKGMLNLMGSIPFVSFVNRLAGGVLGLARGVFFLWLLELIILIFGSTTEWGKTVLAAIDQVPALTFIHQNNLLIKLLVEFGVNL